MSKEIYTFGYDEAALAFMSRRTLKTHGGFFAAHLKHDMNVLDVACGPGSVTIGIAERVGSGRVTGIDLNEMQVALAKRAAAEHGISNADFQTGDAYSLPFADASFDALFCNALLEHLSDPSKAMREFLRVLKPGGVVGVAGPHWSRFLIAPMDAALAAAINSFTALQCANGGDVDVGGKLSQLALDAGFERVKLRAAYQNYDPVWLITEMLMATLEDAGEPAHAQTLREWSNAPHATFAMAWGRCIGFKPKVG